MATDELQKEIAEEIKREDEEEEEKERTKEYLHFRRKFDALKGDASEAEKMKKQGNGYFSLGLYSQAAIMYSDALELQPENAVLYCNRAMAYIKQGMPDEALTDAEKSLSIDNSVENIKAHWRKAQALLDLGRPEESEAASDIGLELQPRNPHLNKVRRKAREAHVTRRLTGHWLGISNLEMPVNGPTLPGQNGQPTGIQKRLNFQEEGKVTMTVMGHSIDSTYDLSIEGNPRSMVLRPKSEPGSGPPLPDIVYIFEFHNNDEELWLCHPVGTKDLPEKFEGPGFERMRRVAPPAEADLAQPLEQRCRAYLADMVEVMPLLPPQLPEKPEEDQIKTEVMLMESIAALKRKHGNDAARRAVELARDPSSAPNAELAKLAEKLRQRFVARRIFAPEEEEVASVQVKEPGTKGRETAPTAPQRSGGGCMANIIAKLCSSSK
mmetsp:Transcript_85961/g.161888  ORF Transcript_85961/g.161888 Transcript_85961/m.161888 type:complete len:438 (-) Transcript_85961:8-1321(-)